MSFVFVFRLCLIIALSLLRLAEEEIRRMREAHAEEVLKLRAQMTEEQQVLCYAVV